MRPHATLWTPLALALASCASVEPARDAATDRLRQAVTERVGIAAAAPPVATDGAIDAVVADLLAGELSEADAVRVALLNNRDVRAGYERLGVAAADLVQAGLLRNPVFDAGALLSFGGGTELELGLAQPFVDLFWRPLRQREAALDLDAALASVTRDLVRISFAVRREFVRVRAAQQLVDAQRRGLAAAKAALELMQQLASAGNVVGAQLAAARVAEGRARLDLAAAERAALEAREPLNALLGLWGRHVAWRIAGDLDAPGIEGIDLDDVEARAVAASLELRENRARIDAAAQGARLRSWGRWLPDAGLGAGARREPDGGWALGPSLALELPVADTGAAADAAAQGRVRVLLHRQAQLAVEVRAAARLLRDRLEALDQRARFLQRELLPAQERLLLDILRDYNAMQIGAFDVIAQKQQQLAAVRDHVTTLRDAWLARLDLEELLAGSRPTSALAPYWPTTDSRPNDSKRGDH